MTKYNTTILLIAFAVIVLIGARVAHNTYKKRVECRQRVMNVVVTNVPEYLAVKRALVECDKIK